jgi:hypothetical protein
MANQHHKQIATFIEPFRVKHESKVQLGTDFDPASRPM